MSYFPWSQQKTYMTNFYPSLFLGTKALLRRRKKEKNPLYREQSSFLFPWKGVSSSFPSQKTKYNTVFQEFPETFTAVPALTSPLAEKKSWTFPLFYIERREGPESPALGNQWGSWAGAQVPKSLCHDNFGSRNSHGPEEHGGQQSESWKHIL